MKAFLIVLYIFLFPVFSIQEKDLPEDFVFVDQVIPDIVLEMRYAGSNNFIGKPIEGYLGHRAILTKPTAETLKKVQTELKNQGYCLKIFDAYRPQRAVDHFIEWAKKPGDTLMKSQYYPGVIKRELFNLGYIASRSGHSRGSTLDLTIIDMESGEELNMGGTYDFFGEVSHHIYSGITPDQKKNRELLKKTMTKYGFRPYAKEWWHYTFRPEPFSDTYFDFVIE